MVSPTPWHGQALPDPTQHQTIGYLKALYSFVTPLIVVRVIGAYFPVRIFIVTIVVVILVGVVASILLNA